VKSAPSSNRRVLYGGVAVAVLHVLLFSALVDPGTNAVLLCVNLFAYWNGCIYRRAFSERRLIAYVSGYVALFVLFFGVARSPLLFAAFGMLYAACFRRPPLLGLLLILIFSITIATPYWIQTSLLLGLLYLAVLRLYRERRNRFFFLCFVVGFLLVAAVVLPLLYLCFQTTPQTLLVTFGDSQFRAALWTSVLTASISTGVILLFGVPLAYALARLDFWGKKVFDSLIDLPIVIPQSVTGIALLVVLGPRTPVGAFLKARFGLELPGSYLGIIICQVFVSSPFLIRSAMNAFQDMGPQLENVSRTLGAPPSSTFFRISLPLASGAIFSGGLLSWARAISEVGSLMVFAYHPFTVSIYTYDQFVQYGLREARPAAVLLVILCMWGFLLLRWLRSASLGPLFRVQGSNAS